MGRLIVLSGLAVCVSMGVPRGHGEPSESPYAAAQEKKLVKQIDERQAEYQIQLGGTLDSFNTAEYTPISPGSPRIAERPGFEPNISLAIENVGEHDVVNPWIVINDRHDWFSLDTLTAEVIEPGMTDRQKALALFAVFRDNSYHYAAPQIWIERGLLNCDAYDPIKHLNGYEHTGCSCLAISLATACDHAGLKSRVVNFGVSHWISEVLYDGAWHVFDADRKVFNLKRDNKTVASMADCIADPGLVNRTHHDGFAAPEGEKSNKSHFGANSGAAHATPKGHTMGLTLRPGESLVRWWPAPGKPDAKDLQFGWPRRFAKGKLVYQPDLSKRHLLEAAEFQHNVALFADDGKRPYVHAQRPSFYCELIIPVRSPYRIVGGRIQAEFPCEAKDGFYPGVELSYDGREWLKLWSGPGQKPSKCDKRIDPFIDRWRRHPKYAYFVKITWVPFRSPTGIGLDSLTIETNVEASIPSLPTLRIGPNKVVYRDDTKGAGRVRVTHRWRESSANLPPPAPSAPVAPEDRAKTDSLAPTLRWKAPIDPDGDAIVEYHVEVRDEPRMRFTLSPNLERLTLSGEPEWNVPDGCLVPGERYYWHVRARDQRGAWSPQSTVWSFVAG